VQVVLSMDACSMPAGLSSACMHFPPTSKAQLTHLLLSRLLFGLPAAGDSQRSLPEPTTCLADVHELMPRGWFFLRLCMLPERIAGAQEEHHSYMQARLKLQCCRTLVSMTHPLTRCSMVWCCPMQEGDRQPGVILVTTAAVQKHAGRATERRQQLSGQRSRHQGISATAGAAATSCLSWGSALLCLPALLLQLIVLLFVPRGPLAAAGQLQQPLQGLLVWGVCIRRCVQ
jgi:hypothetical protein